MNHFHDTAQTLADGTGGVPPEWTQGRSSYGGLLAAAALCRLRQLVGPSLPLRYLSAQYLGPTGTQPLAFQAQLLSSGKSVTSARADLLVEGSPRFSLTAVYAQPRTSSLAVEGKPTLAIDPEQLPASTTLNGTLPIFMRHFDLRLASRGESIHGFVRHLTREGPQETALVGLFDAFPPTVMTMLAEIAPASTVTWSVHFSPTQNIEPGSWWSYQAHTVQAHQGYATIVSQLFSTSGQLAAWGEQLVAIYA